MYQAQMLARQRMQSLLKTRSRSMKGRTRDLGGRPARGWAVCLSPAVTLPQAFGPGRAPVPPFWRARGVWRDVPPAPCTDFQSAEPAKGLQRLELAAEHCLRFSKGHFGGKHLVISPRFWGPKDVLGLFF